MDCQCQHEDVCLHRRLITPQICQVLPGGDKEKASLEALAKFIQENCKMREAKPDMIILKPDEGMKNWKGSWD